MDGSFGNNGRPKGAQETDAPGLYLIPPANDNVKPVHAPVPKILTPRRNGRCHHP